MFLKIISGGQTRADRAALDWAISRDVPYGGWCPKGRRAEDGAIPPQYQLSEMTSPDYPSRTDQNVLDSDGTVIISIQGSLGSRGSALTQRLAEKHHKPWIHIHSGELGPGETLRSFVAMHRIQTLNMAGPHASSEPRFAQFVLLVRYQSRSRSSPSSLASAVMHRTGQRMAIVDRKRWVLWTPEDY